MNKQLSISDNDICSDCKHCVYNPGELSFCDKNWPFTETFGDDIQKCLFYERIDSEFENWSFAAFADLNPWPYKPTTAN